MRFCPEYQTKMRNLEDMTWNTPILSQMWIPRRLSQIENVMQYKWMSEVDIQAKNDHVDDDEDDGQKDVAIKE